MHLRDGWSYYFLLRKIPAGILLAMSTKASESCECCSRPGLAGEHLAVCEIQVEGLDCPNEAGPIREALVAVPAVKDVLFELALGRVAVTYDPALAGEKDLLAAVEKAGFAGEVSDSLVPPGAAGSRGHGVSIALATALVAGAMGWCGLAERSLTAGLMCEVSPTHHPVALAALVGAIGLSWWFVLPKAWRSARALRPDLYLLMTIAVVGAIGLGQWFEAATVAVLFGLANLLESWSSHRVRDAVAALFSQVPAEARLRTEAGEALVPAGEVQAGQIVLVLPGERIPLDGKVEAGQGWVDQSPITGESRPVSKGVGAEVLAGSINQDAALEMRVSRPASDSLMSRVIRMVREGQANKSRSEQAVDRFARYYTPVVLAGAVVIALVPPVAGWLAWDEAIMRALVLLVISCPCALVISTPVAVVSAMTALARGGALVKAGRILEVLAGVKAIALDKTGTLTRGEPAVDGVIPLGGYSREEVLRLAASVESRSEHSLGRAIVRAAAEQGLAIEAPQDAAAQPGMGAVGRVGGEACLVGNPRLLRERGIGIEAAAGELERHEDCRHTAMVVATSKGPIGVILAADRIRGSARATVERLRSAGIHTVMLTGDNQGTARAIGEQSRVEQVRAELLPADKAAAVADLRRRYGTVAMVGDGINDAPALATADVGIAMGTIGTDAAIATADVALMSDNLWHLPWLIEQARRTRRTIVANIAVAVGIKAVFLALASAGLANLWMAILADMGASLAVTFNGMRLLSAPHAAEPAGAEPAGAESGDGSGEC